MSTAPDLRVRLSTEGVEEVVAALAKIREEGKKTSAETSKNFEGFNQILGKTKTALGLLGVAVSVGAFVALSKHAAETSQHLEAVAVGAGTSARNLSILASAAALNNVELGTLLFNLDSVSKRVTELREGSPEAAKAFAKIGLAVADFEGRDTVEQIEVIAKALSQFEDDAVKTAAVLDIMQRTGTRLTSTLNELGEVGLEGLAEKGERLGTILSAEVIAKSAQVGQEIELLNQNVSNLAAQFLSGLQPAFSQTFNALAESLAGSGASWELFGQIVGQILRIVVGAVTFLVDTTVTGFLEISAIVGTVAQLTIAIVTFQWQEIPKIYERGIGVLSQQMEDYANRTVRFFENINKAAQETDLPTAPGTVDIEASFRRREAALRSSLDNELAIIKAQLALQDSEAKRFFNDGLATVKDTFDERRRIVNAGLDAELNSLRQRRDLALQDKDVAKGSREAAAFEADIRVKQIQAQQDIIDLTSAELLASRQLSAEYISGVNKLAAAQGRQHRIRLEQINDEALEFEKAIIGLGGTPEQAAAEGDRFRGVFEAAAELETQIELFRQEMNDLMLEKAAIEQDIASAQTSELAGEQAILELERERVEELTKIADAALVAAQATGNPEAIANARAMQSAIRGMGLAASESAILMANLGEQVGTVLASEFTAFLSQTGEEFDSFGDAVIGTISSIIDALRRLLAQLIAMEIVEKLSLSFAGGGQVPGKAAGGLIFGPGSGTSDSVPLRASAGEFIVREAVVSQPGILDHLRALNAGLITANVMSPGRGIPRFAEGGQVQSAEAKIGGMLTVALGDGLVADNLDTPAATRALIKVVSKNKRAISAAIGRK